jgi:hypothetical protein
MSRRDRLIGIALGLVIGVAIVLVLVLGGVGSSVDEATIGGTEQQSESNR